MINANYAVTLPSESENATESGIATSLQELYKHPEGEGGATFKIIDKCPLGKSFTWYWNLDMIFNQLEHRCRSHCRIVLFLQQQQCGV